MIIAVVAVRLMQVTVDDVVSMVAVWNGGVAAGGVVNVAGGLFVRAMAGCALIGIRGTHGDGVVIHVRTVDLMQMAVVEVVGVAVVLDGGVAATCPVLMRVSLSMLGVRRAAGGDEGNRDEQEQDFFHVVFGC